MKIRKLNRTARYKAIKYKVCMRSTTHTHTQIVYTIHVYARTNEPNAQHIWQMNRTTTRPKIKKQANEK